jgi:hypothetical protein
MTFAQQNLAITGFLRIPLRWFFTFALLLQVVGTPALMMRDAAASADPSLQAQLLCSQSGTGKPLNQHHKVPAPDSLQNLWNHSGFGIVVFGSVLTGMPLLLSCHLAFAGIAATAPFNNRFCSYAARAPPHFF